MKSLRLMLLAGCSLIITQEVCAQTALEPSGIPEIVVTAQKREQNVQNVALSVSVLGGEQLRERGINSAEQISNSVAGLQTYSYLGSQPTFVVRGVGVQDFAPNIAPAAAVYLDEVYLGSNIISGFQVFDTQRVEVLKGPQGDLFGRNTTGGAISYTTQRPTKDFEGYVEAGYGNYDTMALNAAVGGPISSAVRFRIAGRYSNQGSGYYTNNWTPSDSALPLSAEYFNPKHRPGDGREWAARGLLEIESGDATFLINVHGGERHADVIPFTPIGYSSIPGAAQPCGATALGGTYDPRYCGDAFGYTDLDGDPYKVKVDYVGRYSQTNYGASLRSEFDLGSMTLTSITAYDDAEKVNHTDTDGSAHFEMNQTRGTTLKQYSEELRLTSTGASPFQWILGGYAGTEKIDLDFFGALSPLLGFTNFTDPALNTRAASAVLLSFKQDTTSLAVYGHAEYALSEKATVVLGARYTHEHKKFYSASSWRYDDGMSPSQVLVNFGSTAADAALVDTSVDFSSLSGKIGLNYKPVDALLLYLNLSQGFKSGGYDGDVAFTRAQLDPFKEEILTSIEAGWKATLDNRRLYLNGAVFLYNFKDPQVRVAQADPVTGLPFNKLINLAKAQIVGGEVQLDWLPVRGLDLHAGIAFNDSDIKDSAQPVFNGNVLPLAAKFSATFAARYRFPLSGALDAAIGFDGKYNGSYYLNPENTNFLKSSPYTLLNARASLIGQGKWEVSAWVNNITKKTFALQSFALFGAYSVAYSPPRTYGLTARLSW